MLQNYPQMAISIDATARALGGRINAYRISRQITTQQLAAEMGVSRPTLARLIDGESTALATLLRALNALGIADNIDLLVPDTRNSPIAQMQGGKEYAKRHRVRKTENTDDAAWAWGDTP